MQQQVHECHMNSVSQLKQCIINWRLTPSKAKCYWCSQQQVKTVTAGHACVQTENTLKVTVSLLQNWKIYVQIYVQIKYHQLCLSSERHHNIKQVRWQFKPPSMAYLLSNNCTDN